MCHPNSHSSYLRYHIMKLQRVNWDCKIMLLVYSFTLLMFVPLTMDAQPFVFSHFDLNPPPAPDCAPDLLGDVGGLAQPTFVDIDGDGDMDAFVGESSGSVIYYINNGDAASSNFVLASNNPLGLVNTNTNAAPAFVDIDQDGDFDVFIGRGNGFISYYKKYRQ